MNKFNIIDPPYISNKGYISTHSMCSWQEQNVKGKRRKISRLGSLVANSQGILRRFLTWFLVYILFFWYFLFLFFIHLIIYVKYFLVGTLMTFSLFSIRTLIKSFFSFFHQLLWCKPCRLLKARRNNTSMFIVVKGRIHCFHNFSFHFSCQPECLLQWNRFPKTSLMLNVIF